MLMTGSWCGVGGANIVATAGMIFGTAGMILGTAGRGDDPSGRTVLLLSSMGWTGSVPLS